MEILCDFAQKNVKIVGKLCENMGLCENIGLCENYVKSV